VRGLRIHPADDNGIGQAGTLLVKLGDGFQREALYIFESFAHDDVEALPRNPVAVGQGAAGVEGTGQGLATE